MTTLEERKLKSNLFILPGFIFIGIFILFAAFKSPDDAMIVQEQQNKVNTMLPNPKATLGKDVKEAEYLKNRFENSDANNISDYNYMVLANKSSQNEATANGQQDTPKLNKEVDLEEQANINKLKNAGRQNNENNYTNQTRSNNKAEILKEAIKRADEETAVSKDTKQEQTPEKKITIEEKVVPKQNRSRFNSSSIKKTGSEIQAKVYETVMVRNGDQIKIILNENTLSDDGMNIPKGTIITGLVNFTQNRINIHTQTVRYNNSILPFRRTIHDIDGLAGIAVPSSLRAEFNKQLSNEATDQVSDVIASNTSKGIIPS
jgi:hypothetical protein